MALKRYFIKFSYTSADDNERHTMNARVRVDLETDDIAWVVQQNCISSHHAAHNVIIDFMIEVS